MDWATRSLNSTLYWSRGKLSRHRQSLTPLFRLPIPSSAHRYRCPLKLYRLYHDSLSHASSSPARRSFDSVTRSSLLRRHHLNRLILLFHS